MSGSTSNAGKRRELSVRKHRWHRACSGTVAMTKQLLAFLGLGVLTSGCIDESPPAEHMFGQFELTRTIQFYWADRTDIGYVPQVQIALQSDQVVVASDANREAIVLRHGADSAAFDVIETGWSIEGTDASFAVVAYEIEERRPGVVTGLAGASLRNDAGEVRGYFSFDVEGVRIAP